MPFLNSEICREDEHQLIAQYCRSLNGDAGGGSAMGTSAPRSPVQLLAALDSNHKEEIETMIRYFGASIFSLAITIFLWRAGYILIWFIWLVFYRELEEENANLQAEYERLRSQQSPSMSFSLSSSPDETTPLPQGASNVPADVERDMLAEARLLRQHKTRLEARMKILEEHNRQLETQLGRLRQLLDEVRTQLTVLHAQTTTTFFCMKINEKLSVSSLLEVWPPQSKLEHCRPVQSLPLILQLIPLLGQMGLITIQVSISHQSFVILRIMTTMLRFETDVVLKIWQLCCNFVVYFQTTTCGPTTATVSNG